MPIGPLLRTLVLLTAAFSEVDARQITGRVVDRDTGEPLAGASIVVIGSTMWATTNASGQYQIDGAATGSYIVAVRYLGYDPAERRVTVKGNSVEVNFSLVPSVIEISTVDVTTAGIQEQSDPQTSRVSLPPRQARALPGGGDDVLRALQAVPGVVATSDYSARMVVRGGGPDENLIIMDNVEIFNPYRLYGVISAFNPVVVSDVTLLTGGFPARYGDRLSSVLRVRIREGVRDRPIAGSLNTSVSNANMVLEGMTGVMDGSWLITARRSYYDLILGPIARSRDSFSESFTFPNFMDLQGKLTLRPSPGHKIHVSSVFSRDALDMAVAGSTPDPVSGIDEVTAIDLSKNEMIAASWQWSRSANLLHDLHVSWYNNTGNFGSDGRIIPRDQIGGNQLVASADTVNTFEFVFDQSFVFRKWSLNQEVTGIWRTHLVEAGAGVDFLRTALLFDLQLNDVGRAYLETLQGSPFGRGAIPEFLNQSRDYYRYHAFLQDRISLWDDRLHLQAGIRFDRYRIISRSYVSPRMNLSLAIDSWTTLRAAWGIFRQSAGQEKLLDRRQIFDLSSEINIAGLRAESATHNIIGLTRTFGAGYLVRAEGYLKQIDDLIVQQRELTERWEAQYTGSGLVTNPDSYRLRRVRRHALVPLPVNASEGRAVGAEVTLEKRRTSPRDRLTGWISYAISRAERSRVSSENPEDRITVPMNYDRRHVANLVLNFRLGRSWEVGVTFRYGSGFPFTPPVSHEPMIVSRLDINDPAADPTVEILTNAETGLVRFDVNFGDELNENSKRLPPYHRLDIRLTRDARLLGMNWEFYIDVMNVYNRTNVLSYNHFAIVNPDKPQYTPQLAREQISMIPVLPTIGISFTF